MDIISEFENGDVIARIDGFDMPLHNAAPAMLAALEGTYKHFLQHMERDWFDDDDHDAMQKMFDAIAKAKGEAA